MKTITTLTLSFVLAAVSQTLYAQSNANIAIKIGRHGQPTSINANSGYKMSLHDLKENSNIYIYSKEGDYKVQEFQLSMLPKNGELLGPFKIEGQSIATAFDKISVTPANSTRVYIEQIKAFCDACATQKEITAKGLVILLN